MSDYVFRPARQDDRAGITALWQAVFGDSEAFVSAFLDQMTTPDGCFVAECGGRILSMGFLLTGPRAGNYSCAYIYAMATHEAHRGHGLAGRIALALRARAYGKGIDIVATLPAEESLVEWYSRRLDMSPVFRKGGEGVVFPDYWVRFALEYCPEHDPDTPGTLLACSRSPAALAAVRGLGWEYPLD